MPLSKCSNATALTEPPPAAKKFGFYLTPSGPLTWARIVDVNATLPNVTASRFPGNLQNGSRGDNVRVLQQNLNDLVPFYPSIPRLNADGIFGPITQSAVVAFQRIFGMSQSGIANQTTWNLIMSMRNLLTQGLAASIFEEFFETADSLDTDEHMSTFMTVTDSGIIPDGFDDPMAMSHYHESPAPTRTPDMFLLLLAMYLMRRFR